MEVFNLFPTPIGFFNHEEGISEEIYDFLSKQEQRPNNGNNTSEDKYILKQKKVFDLTNFIEKSLNEYFISVYSPKNDVRLRITQSWINFTKPGEFHHQHSHPCSFISGCYYIDADKEIDKIYFHNTDYKMIKFPPVEWNLYNSDSWWIPVNKGNLVLFPSSLSHNVERVQGEKTRISLSFNTFPVGYIGNEYDLTALHLEK